jgi:N-acetylmuramic acid 6-phosphate etherase
MIETDAGAALGGGGTEGRNPRTFDLDRLSTPELLARLNAEDRTVAEAVRGALPAIVPVVEAIVGALAMGGRLIYVGAGTSGRLCVLDAVECVPTFGVDPSLVVGLIAGGPEAMMRSVEGAEDDAEAGRRDLLALRPCQLDVVVGVAASGRTPYVLGALRAAHDAGARTAGLSCNAPSPLLDCVDLPIAVVVGPEAIAGSTRLKAGTAQKMVLNMLSTASMVRWGKVYGNLMVDVRITNRKLAIRAEGIVADVAGVSRERAAELLGEAGQNARVAIVMALHGVCADEARNRLRAVGGALPVVLGRRYDRREV